MNKKLYEECSKKTVDYAAVEDLLRQGADPLGGMENHGWELLEHVYEILVCDSQDNQSVELPKITELFLQYGMDVDHPKIPYDGENSLNPLWSFAFVTNENAIRALQMLLDHGLSADSFAKFWGHAISDFFNVECGDPQNNEFWHYECTWTFKMLMLGASYDHIIEADEGPQNFICCDYNTYDLHNFRSWDKYEYIFDTTHCERRPELYKSIVRIYDKENDAEVWRIGVGKAGRDVLAELQKYDP